MVGTRWNVLDPLGAFQNQYADNPKVPIPGDSRGGRERTQQFQL